MHIVDTCTYKLVQEAYCNALNKLKEGMEDPLKETSSFINSVRAQLEELTRDSNKIKQTEPN